MSLVYRVIAMSLLLSLSAGIGALWFAPATWLDLIIYRASNEQLRLVQAHGSLWKGSGVIAIELGGLKPLTQPLHFEITPSLVPPGLTIQLSGQGLRWVNPSAEIVYRSSMIQIPAGQITGLMIDSSNLANFLGLAKISAQPSLRWPAMTWSSKGVSSQGKLLIEINNISSGLVPIQPLADVRAELAITDSDSKPWHAVASDDSVIMLKAQGDLLKRTAAGSLRCQRLCDYLNGALSLLGRPSGEDYVFSFNPY